MYKRDFLTRTVEEIGRLLVEILSLKKENRKERALKVIQETLDTYYHFTIEAAINLSDEKIEELLTDPEAGNFQKLDFLAELMIQLADYDPALYNQENNKSLIAKALTLLEKIQEKDINSFNWSRRNKIASIEQLISEFNKNNPEL